MSATATERSDAELQFGQSGNFPDPSSLQARMAFWDLGYKREPRCLPYSTKPIPPDIVSSCECVKAGTSTAAICELKEGFKCFMKQPLSAAWTEEEKSEKNLDTCSANFPARLTTSISGLTPALIGAAVVDDRTGHLIILGLAALLILSQLRK